MHRFHRLSLFLLVASAGLVLADEPPRRMTRVASGPVRTAEAERPPEASPKAPPTVKLAVPPTTVQRVQARPDLLEPTHLPGGMGRGAVACFQVEAERAAIWQLVVREVDGPVAQIFEGEGPPPSSIPWDGRLLDGGLAWSGMTYTYEMAWVDSTGGTDSVAGVPFTLPDYTRDERAGISFLMTGDRLTPGGRGDAVAAARAGLRSVAERLDQAGGLEPVRVEVMGRDEATALALGQAIRAALAELMASGGRSVDLYVGEASAAPRRGAVLITTVPLHVPSS